MSRFENEFVKPMDREIQRKVKDVSVTLVKDIAEEAFTNILNFWPVDTAWSQANHRINIGPNPEKDFPVQPPTRPTQRGALIGAANENEATQLAKLDSLTFGDSVLIGNAVPYAADVSFQPFRGTIIYFEAAAIAGQLISFRIG